MRINFRSHKNCCVKVVQYIDYVKDGALQVVDYQIPPQLFKLRLYMPIIFMHMHVSGTCDVVQSYTYCSYILVLKVGAHIYLLLSIHKIFLLSECYFCITCICHFQSITFVVYIVSVLVGSDVNIIIYALQLHTWYSTKL